MKKHGHDFDQSVPRTLEDLTAGLPRDPKIDVRLLIATSDPDQLTQAAVGHDTQRVIDEIALQSKTNLAQIAEAATAELDPIVEKLTDERQTDLTAIGTLQDRIFLDGLRGSDETPSAADLDAIFNAPPIEDPYLGALSDDVEWYRGLVATNKQAVDEIKARLEASTELDSLAAEVLSEQEILSRLGRIRRKIGGIATGASLAGVPVHLLMQPAIENGDSLAGSTPTFAAAGAGALIAWSLASPLIDRPSVKGRLAKLKAQRLYKHAN